VLFLGLICVVCPGLCRLDYEPLVYDDDGNQQLLLSSRRVRREDGGEGSGLGEDYAAEDDDEDQEYFSSSTELLPSRQPGQRIGCCFQVAGSVVAEPGILSRFRIFFHPGSVFFPSRIRIFSISDPVSASKSLKYFNPNNCF
jgi:hypothetical protein